MNINLKRSIDRAIGHLMSTLKSLICAYQFKFRMQVESEESQKLITKGYIGRYDFKRSLERVLYG